MKDNNINKESLLRPFVEAPTSYILSSGDKMSQNWANQMFNIRNRHLYTLGIILLELIINKPLQYFRTSKASSETDDKIAWRIERKVSRRTGPVWADVVLKCLHCPFQGDIDLKDDSFLSTVYSEVISPLVDLAERSKLSKGRQFSGIAAIDALSRPGSFERGRDIPSSQASTNSYPSNALPAEARIMVQTRYLLRERQRREGGPQK